MKRSMYRRQLNIFIHNENSLYEGPSAAVTSAQTCMTLNPLRPIRACYEIRFISREGGGIEVNTNAHADCSAFKIL